MKYRHKNERGVAHVLALVLVVALIGIVGFLGYNAWQRQQVDAGGKSTVGKRVAFNAGSPKTFRYDKNGLCQLNGYLYLRDTSKKNDTSILEVSFDNITPFTYKLEYHLNKRKPYVLESQNYLGAPTFPQTFMGPGVHYFKTGIAGKNITFNTLRTDAKHWTTVLKAVPMTKITQCAHIAFTSGDLSVCKYQNAIYVKRTQMKSDYAADSTAKLGFRFDGTMRTINNLYELGPGTQYFSGPIRGKQLELIHTSNDIYSRRFGAQDIQYSRAVSKIPSCKFL